MKKFTLIELVVSIVVLGILLAIVLTNISANKKEAIRVAVSSNTKIIQGAVDAYFLKGNKIYPTINNEQPTLEDPVLIDVNMLVAQGYIKQDLDLSKIKVQYYWLDKFGTVWGATEGMIRDFTILGDNQSSEMSFILDSFYTGYSVYKVTGGNLSSLEKIDSSQLIATEEVVGVGTSYRQLYSDEVELTERVRITIDLTGAEGQYLISGIDQYGLETVPSGNPSRFKPIKEREGTFFYKVETLERMYFLDFWSVEEEPGDSSVKYRFSVKKEKDGEYGEWFDTFDEVLAEENGYGVQVEMVLKGDDKGNYPTVWDLHILYSFKGGDIEYPNFCMMYPMHCDLDFNVCEFFPHLCNDIGLETGCIGADCGSWASSILNPSDKDPNGNSGPPTSGGTGGGPGEETTGGPGGGGSGGTTGKNWCSILPQLCQPVSCLDNSSCLIPAEICINDRIKTGKVDGLYYLSQNFVLGENERLSSLHIPKPSAIEGSLFKQVIIQYAEKGTGYKTVSKLSDIPTGACINIVYVYSQILGFPPELPKTCDETSSCPVTCVMLDNCPKPIKDVISKDEDPYVTLYDMRFFAHTAVGETSKWLSYTKEDTVPEGTRILYNFSLGDKGGYAAETTEFPTNSKSRSIMAHVYFQVHKDYLKSGVEPTLQSFMFTSDKGNTKIDLTKPILEIYYNKDPKAKGNRTMLTTKSKVDWEFYYFDPNGYEVDEVEWTVGNDNVKNQSYEIGKHSIGVRVKNTNGDWSQWAAYQFDVYDDKPVAILKQPTFVRVNSLMTWEHDSYDPDGDEIVQEEWSGDKRAVYTAGGTYTVSLRVQSEDGKWSEWSTIKFTVRSFFNGRTYVVVPTLSNHHFESNFTAQVKLKHNGGDYRGVFNNGYYTSSGYEMRFGRENSGQYFFARIITNKGNFTIGTNLPKNVDMWLTLTYDGSTLSLYRDSTLIKSIAASGKIRATSTPVTIGNNGSGSEFFSGGDLYEFRLWEKSLSKDEIIHNTTNPTTGKEKDMILNLKFDLPVGGGIDDLTDFENNGVIR